ncbi:MAG: hypothetical protein Q9224_000867 [Gallowayella concinna]
MIPTPVTRRVPSPTLTNPDMILPESQPDRNISSPGRTDEPSSPPQWHRPVNSDDQMRFAVPDLFGNGPRLRHRSSEKALKTQDTPDIRPQSKHSEVSQRSTNSALASSPLLHEAIGVKSMGFPLNRDGSNDNWDALDDGSVISESVSPLVEAERESYMMSESGGIDGYKFSEGFRKAIAAEEEDESYSHAAMSVRAEEILANAKRRLTEMESNLNRARHTANRPSSSMSSFNTNGHESQSLYTLPKTSSPSKHRQQNSPPSGSNSKGHARVFSETSVPSSMQTSPRHGEGQVDAVRNMSCIGSGGIDASTTSITKQGSESRDWFWAGLTRNPSHGSRHNNYGLQPLNEDGPPPSTFESPERQQSPPAMDRSPGIIPSAQQESATASPEHNSPSSNGLTRARSTNQMRDIRDQMQDLKGKISSLKQRAREDSLRRRSLQSLRTPSPFTAAEQWYAGAPGYSRDRSGSRPSEGSPPPARPRIEEEDETKQYPVQEPDLAVQGELQDTADGMIQDEEGTHGWPEAIDDPIARENDDSPRTVIDKPVIENDRPVDQSALEESPIFDEEDDVEDGPDEGDQVLPEPSALPRHEDRPDAFDYEHLFLHSGMGTLSQGRKSRSSSHSSTYSVETTKPNRVSTETSEVSRDSSVSLDDSGEESPDAQHSAHARKGSVDSVSTVATFATATEGDGKSVDSDTDEEEWVYKRPMAGSWEPEYPRHRKAAVGRQTGQQPSVEEIKKTTQARSPPQSRTPITDPARSPTDVPMEASASRSSVAVPDLLGFLTSRLPSDDIATSPRPIELNDSDKELAEKLVRGVARVCGQLQAFSIEGNKYGGRPWRRRLDGARRVLDGETNGEVF